MKRERTDENDCSTPRRGPGAAFLLAQVGAHAAANFAERLAEVNLAPAHAGIFRILAATPAISQQALAAALGTVPSRLVALMNSNPKGWSSAGHMKPIGAVMHYI